LKPRIAALCLAATAFAHANSALAGLPDTYGFGSRAAAMVGAVGADAKDFSAVAYNPAGLVEASGVSVSVGYTMNRQRLLVNERDSGVDDVRGLVAGVVAPGRVGSLPFAFGVAVHLPDDGISFLKARRQEAPRWELYDTRQQLLFLAATLAIRPLPWLEVGGGMGYLSATRGQFGIRGSADLAAPYDSALEHEVDADLTAVRYPLLGLRVGKPGWGAIGLSYRGASKLDLQLGARLAGAVKLGALEVPLLYALEARTFSSFSPAMLTVAYSFQRVERLHFNVDLAWVHWSAYESPVARIQAELHVEPPPGAPVSLPSSPAPTTPIPPHFRDRVVPRVGVEWRLPMVRQQVTAHDADVPRVEVPLRAGFSYEMSPVPEPRGVTTFLDADRYTFALGAGLAVSKLGEVLPGTLRFDVHAALSVLPSRSVSKRSPADFTGDVTARGSSAGFGANAEVAF